MAWRLWRSVSLSSWQVGCLERAVWYQLPHWLFGAALPAARRQGVTMSPNAQRLLPRALVDWVMRTAWCKYTPKQPKSRPCFAGPRRAHPPGRLLHQPRPQVGVWFVRCGKELCGGGACSWAGTPSWCSSLPDPGAGLSHAAVVATCPAPALLPLCLQLRPRSGGQPLEGLLG